MFARKRAVVYGRDLAPPRLTATGALLLVAYLGAPALAFILALDAVVAALIWAVSGDCVALWCLF